ncbi:MAG: hypothetical protein M3083_13245 [Actinomycetota bacterium]|nr:hypothetical protein [Actinomycetota bacterium]MDQ6948153.1 hypothetical protein [Actinomycetota bacterium]
MSNRAWLLVLGPMVALWAALPRFVSPPFHTASANELADHLVPAAVVLAVWVWALLEARRGRPPGVGMLTAGLVILLAGFWMGATHLPLLLQAQRGEAPWAATVHHLAAALAVIIYGAMWTTRYWNTSPERTQ